jgi:uncharacterized RDD family membrane protein YckC
MNDRSSLRSCHEILGVQRDATPDELADAYLRTAMRVHPSAHGDTREKAQARLRFAQAAEAWAVLSRGMAIRGTGETRDANALAVFDESLARRALVLAHQRLNAEAILRRLVDEGCPQMIAWPAAEHAARMAALGVRARPLPGAASPGSDADARTGAGPSRRADGAGGADDGTDPFGVPLPGPARLSERIAAGVADAVVLFVLCTAPVLMLGRSLEWSPILVDRLAILATLLGAAAYYVSAETAWGTTPGKRLLGLSVSVLDGGALDRRRALTRHGVRTLSLCLAGIGLLTVPLTGRRQAVHDLLTGTCVLAHGSHRPELVKALCALPVLAALGAVALAYLGAR